MAEGAVHGRSARVEDRATAPGLQDGLRIEAGGAQVASRVPAEGGAATEFARQSPWPVPEAALEDVYA